MKVLYIGLDIYSRHGGIARYSQSIVRALADLCEGPVREGVIISLWDRTPTVASIPAQVQYFACESNKVRTGRIFLDRLLHTRPDVVLYGHVLLAPLAVLGRLLQPRARHLLIVYGIEVWGVGYRSTPWIERLIVRHTFDKIITISRYTQKRMQTAYDIPSDHFVILPPAVDKDLLSAPKGREEKRPSAHLLTVARLTTASRHKGVHRVIRVLPRVLKVFPDLVYYVVGDGNLKDELQNLARDMGVQSHVRFLGRISDELLDSVYRRSSLFVMPSSGEGFGIVFLEAWLRRLPVIAGDRDASAEVVTDGMNGLTIDPESEDALAQAIIKLLTEPETAHRMGEEGYRTIIEKYTHEHFRHNLLALIRSG
jgi:phosphatidylinositol alpha-1,6-mannosyltransferase